jgi:hypothetical protein
VNYLKKPYIIPCLFNYAQSIIRKPKTFKMFKKRINIQSLEWLYNFVILCFLNVDKIEKQFQILKSNIENENEQELINSYEKTWIKRKK